MELIFIHIPKTAGSSLRSVLHKVYGRDAVITVGVDIPATKEIIYKDMLPAGTRVLTGHLAYPQVEDLRRQTGAKIISFLRDPTERYISHFFHLRRRQTRTLGLRHELHARLPIWVHLCLFRYHNVMSRSLKPLPMQGFDFIGFRETFSDDVKALAKLLDWPEEGAHTGRFNANENTDYPLTARKLPDVAGALIRRVNAADTLLYEEALSVWRARPDK